MCDVVDIHTATGRKLEEASARYYRANDRIRTLSAQLLKCKLERERALVDAENCFIAAKLFRFDLKTIAGATCRISAPPEPDVFLTPKSRMPRTRSLRTNGSGKTNKGRGGQSSVDGYLQMAARGECATCVAQPRSRPRKGI
jgi:hypothetical protein